MKSTSVTADQFANSPAFKAVTRNTQIGQTNFAVIKQIKEMYDKPAAVLMDWLGISERTAKRKLGGQRDISIEEVGKLIRSERGFEIVTAIMADARPEWWRICVPVMEAADIRKMQIAARKRVARELERALDEDRQLSAAISRAEALAVHDEEHMRSHIDALRASGRASRGAMVKRRMK